MKLFAAILLLFCTGAHAQFKLENFKPLYSLEQTWQMKNRKGYLIEQWTKVNDSLLTSKSYQVADKDTAIIETVQLKFSKGTITYTPTVPNQNAGKPVTFTLVNIREGQYRFENKAHDYPQQIIYQPGEKTLHVITRALNDPPEKERHFNFSRN